MIVLGTSCKTSYLQKIDDFEAHLDFRQAGSGRPRRTGNGQFCNWLIGKKQFFCGLLALKAAYLLALPQEGSLAAGQGTIFLSSPCEMRIDSSERAVLNWKSFSLAEGEKVVFSHASTRSAILNRVLGKEASHILGKIEAKGSIYLVNPYGIIFGKEAVIDTGSFLATTLDTATNLFMAGGRLLFSGDSTASVVNLGVIESKAGSVALLAHRVENHGALNSASGVYLAAGHEILLQILDKGLLYIRPSVEADGVMSSGSISATEIGIQAKTNPYSLGIRQEGSINATMIVKEQNRIYLRIANGNLEIGKEAILTAPNGTIAIEVQDGVITNNGIVAATGGKISLSSACSSNEERLWKPFYNEGVIDVSGNRGGSIAIDVLKFSNNGSLKADGREEMGGQISIGVKERYMETQNGRVSANGRRRAGEISIISDLYFSSGCVLAAGDYGGVISIDGSELSLAAATIDVSGKSAGGRIIVGNGISSHLFINLETKLLTDAFDPLAKGNIELLDARGIERSTLRSFPSETLGAMFPKACFCQAITLDDPNPVGTFPSSPLFPLPNGNLVVLKPGDDFAALNAGAVYLFNGSTGALISALRGSNANDRIGQSVTILANGNYVISSLFWQNPLGTLVGAATWGSATSGVGGSVSASNSLIGTLNGDQIGSGGIAALSNGNYVVASPEWINSTGAATWGNGLGGTVGPVTAANSLVGSVPGDRVGVVAVPLAHNGNYVVNNIHWNNGALIGAGAATWGNGLGGTVGPVTTLNSLHGTTAGDGIGNAVALTNGHYVVGASSWNNGALTAAGAATWGNGLGGTVGPVTTGNSLHGTSAFDRCGHQVVALANGNYAVLSQLWNNGAITNVGAVTWANGSGGTTGPVTTANSLYGATSGDLIGNNGIHPLTNGNYVVCSDSWDNGAALNAGAATWGSGLGGTVGPVTISNSLFGTTTNDFVGNGQVVALLNGNYVVISNGWNGSLGAVTWGDGSTGTTGPVSFGNSLTGGTAGDLIGVDVVPLSNGNYVVVTDNWTDPAGPTASVGAVTWASGTGGTFGLIGTDKSLVGSIANDQVGRDGVLALTNGNYVVASSRWSQPEQFGALTWASGSIPTAAAVSGSNSLIGSHTNDLVGFGTKLSLPNGDAVCASPFWNSFTGAASVVNGTTGLWCGVLGEVTNANSVVGSSGGRIVNAAGIDPVHQYFYLTVADSLGNQRLFGIFYNACPRSLPKVPAKGVHEYLIALSEPFQSWTATSWGGYLSIDGYPPDQTAKDLLQTPPSLMRRGILRARPMTFYQGR